MWKSCNLENLKGLALGLCKGRSVLAPVALGSRTNQNMEYKLFEGDQK